MAEKKIEFIRLKTTISAILFFLFLPLQKMAQLSNFQLRSIFGILYAAAVIGGCILGPGALLIIAMIILFACWKEFGQLNNLSVWGSWGIGILNLLFFGAMFAGPLFIQAQLIWPIALLALLFLFLLLLFIHGIEAANHIQTILSGILYLSVPVFLFLLLPQISNPEPAEPFNYMVWQQHLWIFTGKTEAAISNYPLYHLEYPLMVFIFIWSSDTFAYLVGRALGKHPLHSSLSPKKTWEGFAGGTILTAVIGFYLFQSWHLSNPIMGAILGAFMSVFGTAGDLFESALKRKANVKDSGNFLPGHGGALDRFDSFFFGVILVWAWLFIQFFN